MAPDPSRLRVLLVQIRDRAAVIDEEQASFAARTGLRRDQFAVANPLRQPLSADLLTGVDAVMIGGAGAYSVTETYEWTASLAGLCRACAEHEVPLFGSCWGHQFVARVFGGTVVNDPDRAELGTHEVELTDAGAADPLFGALPCRFGTQMGHHDRVSVLPPGAVELARNDRVPFQAFRLGDLPIYGTQFHSELDERTERQRLVTYRSYYPEMADDVVFQRTLGTLRPTPAADSLLRRFLLLYAVQDGERRLADEFGAEAARAASSQRPTTAANP